MLELTVAVPATTPVCAHMASLTETSLWGGNRSAIHPLPKLWHKGTAASCCPSRSQFGKPLADSPSSSPDGLVDTLLEPAAQGPVWLFASVHRHVLCGDRLRAGVSGNSGLHSNNCRINSLQGQNQDLSL